MWSGVSSVDAAELCSTNDQAGVSDECDPAPLTSNSDTTKSEPRSDEDNDEKDDTPSQTLLPLLELWVITRDDYVELCPSTWARALKPDAIEECESALRSLVIRAANSEETTPTTPPIRIITEGQTTTFTVPNPQNRQELYCSPATRISTTTTVVIDGISYSTTTYKTRKAGTYYLPSGTERSSDEPFTCGSGADRATYGVCQGPYTVELFSRDSRLGTTGNQIQVTTTPSGQGNNDSGPLEIVYYLNGTRVRTSASSVGEPDIVENIGCTLQETTRVEVRLGTRPGMTAAVSQHAPPQEWLDGTTTTNWTCTQELIDYYRDELQSLAPCTLGDEVETTTKNTFPTPSGCVVVVTIAANGRGFGSTSCLPQAQLESHGTMIGVDIDTLPSCPLSTDTDDMNAIPEDSSERKRCVARN